MQGSNNRNLQHCREVIRACLNTVEERGDTYVAIHKDEDTECVKLRDEGLDQAGLRRSRRPPEELSLVCHG